MTDSASLERQLLSAFQQELEWYGEALAALQSRPKEDAWGRSNPPWLAAFNRGLEKIAGLECEVSPLKREWKGLRIEGSVVYQEFVTRLNEAIQDILLEVQNAVGELHDARQKIAPEISQFLRMELGRQAYGQVAEGS